MSENSVLKDEKQRKKIVIYVVLVIAAVMTAFVIFMSRAQKKYVPPPPPPKVDLTGKADTPKDAWIAQSSTQLSEQEKKIKELQAALTDMKRGGMPTGAVPVPNEYPPGTPPPPPSSSGTGFPPPPAPFSSTASPSLSNVPHAPGEIVAPGGPGGKGSPQAVKDKPMNNLIVIESGKSLSKTEAKPGSKPDSKQYSGSEGETEPKKDAARADAMIPTGSFVKAVLLTGVDAPTGSKGKGNPYPVLLRIVDMAQLPNRFRGDIKECFLVGEAVGELSSERAHMRLNTLSCINSVGNVIESPISAYVTGEDGKTGVSGRVVTKQGAILSRSLIAGFLQGVAQAFNASATVVNVSPAGSSTTLDPNQTFTAGLGGGVSKASEELAKFYLEMAKEMFPVIEINAGRRVEVVFLDRVKLREAK